MTRESTEQTDRGHAPLWMTLAWAGMLAASWTWVIGMFLPVMLVRDHGLLGFLAFAVPNMLGAAAFAWWVTSAQRSEAFVGLHRRAGMGFSDVTIMFHAFGVTCLILPLFGWTWALGTVALGAVVWGLAVWSIVSVAWLGLALVGVSVAVVGLFLQRAPEPGAIVDLAITGERAVSMLWLLPVMAGGFLLCPYLDLTFHRVRERCSVSAGKLAFAIGFGGLFAVMIVLSVFYAPYVVDLFAAEGPVVLPTAVVLWLGIHVCGQTAYTVGLHLHEVTSRRGGHGVFRVMVFSIVAAAAGFWVYGAPLELRGERIELGYRLFLLAYGLLFPAYVLICVVPPPRVMELRMAWRVCLVTVIVASPMAYAGFVDGRQPWWSLGALGVIGLGRLALRWVPTEHRPLMAARSSGDQAKV
ncbi:MAG: hypothetical protein RIG82_09635 [Phycisphaeraceae bacterium]